MKEFKSLLFNAAVLAYSAAGLFYGYSFLSGKTPIVTFEDFLSVLTALFGIVLSVLVALLVLFPQKISLLNERKEAVKAFLQLSLFILSLNLVGALFDIYRFSKSGCPSKLFMPVLAVFCASFALIYVLRYFRKSFEQQEAQS
jgi:hypothetical protein